MRTVASPPHCLTAGQTTTVNVTAVFSLHFHIFFILSVWLDWIYEKYYERTNNYVTKSDFFRPRLNTISRKSSGSITFPFATNWAYTVSEEIKLWKRPSDISTTPQRSYFMFNMFLERCMNKHMFQKVFPGRQRLQDVFFYSHVSRERFDTLFDPFMKKLYQKVWK